MDKSIRSFRGKYTIFRLRVCDLPIYTIVQFWNYMIISLKIHFDKPWTDNQWSKILIHSSSSGGIYKFIRRHHQAEFTIFDWNGHFRRFSIISQLVTNNDWGKFPFRVRVYSKSGLVLDPDKSNSNGFIGVRFYWARPWAVK